MISETYDKLRRNLRFFVDRAQTLKYLMFVLKDELFSDGRVALTDHSGY